jgi:4-hydroxy-2-oxoheptanedioate aldolase
VAEALAGCGFDWLLIDGEHAPNDPRSALDQLRAMAPYGKTHAVVRAVQADVALVKQYLDIGAQTLLIPMIDTAEQAALMVQAMRYPPEGIRGMGAALARASRWNQVDDYLNQANGQMCLLVQAETVTAVNNLKAIAETEGVDGVFFGPADLSASMGHRGSPATPRCRKPSWTASPPCAPPAKPLASSPPTRRWRSSTSTRARCSWRWGWTRRCW